MSQDVSSASRASARLSIHADIAAPESHSGYLMGQQTNGVTTNGNAIFVALRRLLQAPQSLHTAHVSAHTVLNHHLPIQSLLPGRSVESSLPLDISFQLLYTSYITYGPLPHCPRCIKSSILPLG